MEELINKKANVTCFSHKHPPKSKLDEIKDNQNIKIVEGDTRDKEVLEILFKNQKFDFVIHLAAQTQVVDAYNNPIDTFTSNIMELGIYLKQ